MVKLEKGKRDMMQYEENARSEEGLEGKEEGGAEQRKT